MNLLFRLVTQLMKITIRRPIRRNLMSIQPTAIN